MSSPPRVVKPHPLRYQERCIHCLALTSPALTWCPTCNYNPWQVCASPDCDILFDGGKGKKHEPIAIAVKIRTVPTKGRSQSYSQPSGTGHNSGKGASRTVSDSKTQKLGSGHGHNVGDGSDRKSGSSNGHKHEYSQGKVDNGANSQGNEGEASGVTGNGR